LNIKELRINVVDLSYFDILSSGEERGEAIKEKA